MSLVVKSASDLARYFENEPAPWWGARKTYLDERPAPQYVVHASEVPLDSLFAATEFEVTEAESFDLDRFLDLY